MRYQWIRAVARALVFGGWMLPVLLAELVPDQVAARSPETVRMFRVVAGGWAFLAVTYGVVLALRMRRGMVG